MPVADIKISAFLAPFKAFHLNPVPLCLEKTQEKQSASAFWKNLDCGEIDEEKLQDAKRAARSFLPIIILSMES